MRIRELSILLDLGLADSQVFKSAFVIQVEPGDSVDLIVCLVARLQGELPPLSELTMEHPSHFMIRVAAAPGRESFCVLIPKQTGADPRLLDLCATYAGQI